MTKVETLQPDITTVRRMLSDRGIQIELLSGPSETFYRFLKRYFPDLLHPE